MHVRAPEKNGEIIYHLPIHSHCSCVFMFRSVNVNTPASELPKLVDRDTFLNNIEIVPFTYKVRADQDGCCFERTFRSEIIFQIPSPINNNPSIIVKPIVRPIPPISSEERLA
jgi:hypothetical protein